MSDQAFLLSWLYFLLIICSSSIVFITFKGCTVGQGVGSSYEYFIFVFAVFV